MLNRRCLAAFFYVCFNLAVCFGDYKLLKPSKTKFGMVIRNWCQQGVLYRKQIFDQYHFDELYKIQVDHKFNMEMMSSDNFSIYYSDLIVAYFSCGGISQSQPDLEFWRDMPSIVATNFGWPYGLVCYIRRILGLMFFGHPQKRFKPLKNIKEEIN
jgi:hypothetical protein